HQNQIDLLFVDGNTAEKKLILKEIDKAYVEQPEMPPFLEDNSFIWTSERDGFNHLYHFDKSGKLLNKITEGSWDVTSFYGFDPKSKRVFYQSVENGSINRDVYSVKLNGKNKLRLSSETGSNDADFSADFSYFIQTFTNSETPPRFTLHSSKDGKKLKDIKDNQALTVRLKNYKLPVKEFLTLKVGDYDLNMWMIKPVDFDPAKKYPVFMYQYSGPGSQMVSNTWNGTNDYWYYMLAQQGYIVACVDGRGTGMRGADFKKMTYKELGKYEVEDQINAAVELGKKPYVDASRIGIWGWSYGGFMASNAIFQGADVFKMAIAVAPVTSWRFYDTIYTERYMQTPQENPSGYDDNSPINHVDKLKGAFLLVHGSADDNVHVQNSMQMIEALIQANKQFDWTIYPDKNHGIFGGNTRLQLYQKMTNFIKNNL
ncbi:MAG: prolyl oligopeptidase family serine peptidase, partial [Flavobacteriaceae bacterium]|nr:prolyl oligopeptidase family serine peptidase [Flavobacteriaceae bacterium]